LGSTPVLTVWGGGGQGWGAGTKKLKQRRKKERAIAYQRG